MLQNRKIFIFCFSFILFSVAGCVKQEAPSQYLDYSTKTKLRLPFEGEWFVVWGGRSVKQNKHATAKDQRFAMDFVILESERPKGINLGEAVFSGQVKTHREDGSENEQYFCFGKPILSPGHGKVISLIDNVADNKPGEPNNKDKPGNYVIIDHGNGEYSMLAHFKKNSIIVSLNQQVQAGEVIGQCGNSGRSTEPHLHYHLQNSPIWLKGEGLPTQFESYEADGNLVRGGEPYGGQLIKHR